jgi:hypothetical protein
MKYFTVGIPGEPEHGPFSSKGGVMACLEKLPSLEGVEIVRWWWVGDELVETEEMPPAQFRATRSRELVRGATAQWAAARGQL